MTIFRSFVFLSVVLLPSILLAQDQGADAAAKEKLRRRNALIEQVLADLSNMVLGENRAFIGVRIGSLLWDSDEKRARAMFQTAANELMNAQTFAETAQKKTGNQNDLATGGQTRTQILTAIANRDAELALDLLVKTRPTLIARAMASQAAADKKPATNGNYYYLAQNETNLEQSFIRLAAEQNPERMVKLLKDALSKDVTNETINLLKKLHSKDPDAAKEIGSRIVDKLIRSNFKNSGQPNYQVMQTVINFLNDYTNSRNSNDKSFRFDESQMANLSEKLISYFLENGAGQAGYMAYSIVPIAEKLSPSSVEALKKIAKASSGRGDWGGYDPDLQKVFSSNLTADQMLAEVKKFPPEGQLQIYQRAAAKFVEQGDMARATAIINEDLPDEYRDDAIRNLNVQYANNLIGAGKFAEAERLIDEQPENNRTYALINLATAIYQKDPIENKTYAMAVVGKVRAFLPEKPEDNTDMQGFMQIVNAYLTIDPSEAFRMYERLVPQINELAEASVVLSPFQGNNNVRRGEFVLSEGNSFGYYGVDGSAFSTFANKDLDQTVKLVDMFSRREIRIALKLQLAESLK